MGERLDRTQEVSGSNPLSSTRIEESPAPAGLFRPYPERCLVAVAVILEFAGATREIGATEPPEIQVLELHNFLREG